MKLFLATFLAFTIALASVPARAADADVYVMRGLFGFLFPEVIYPMAKDFEDQGYNVLMTTYHPWNQTRILKDAMKKHEASNGKSKVVIIGHSLGGNAATNLSQKFEKAGINIEYLAVIDAPMPKKIGRSPLVVDNFYQFNDFRNPILELENERAILENGKTRKIELTQYNFRGKEGRNGGPGIRKQKENHFSIATNDFTLQRINDKIDEVNDR